MEARHSSVDDLAAGAAQVLGVPAFSRSTVQHYCGLLSERGHIEERYSLYAITEAGRQAIAAGDEGVVQNELSGRTAVRRAVEESLGNTIPEQQWAYIWTDIQKGLAYAFYVRGKEVLDVISHLVDGDRSVEQRGILALLVNNVLRKAIEDHAAPPRRLHLLRAFQDAFLPGDKHGAFEWLAGVAGRFAATCTLGLSADILSVLAQTLIKMRFFADTDVVVSYLCAHEPANAAANAILALSERVGNRMLITDAVVEETARHAMKAYTDYKVRVSPIQKPLDWWEIADLESAFTREFEYLRAEGKAKASQWSQFIARYAGPENYSKQRYTPDTSKMRSILNADGIRLPGAGLIFSSVNGRKWTEPPGKLLHDEVVPAQICRHRGVGLCGCEGVGNEGHEGRLAGRRTCAEHVAVESAHGRLAVPLSPRQLVSASSAATVGPGGSLAGRWVWRLPRRIPVPHGGARPRGSRRWRRRQ